MKERKMLKDLCFEIIQTCPNECKFCSSNSSKNKNTTISLEQFKRTIEHFIKQGGIEEISISGGEPFLHPDLFEMVKFCKEKGIRTVIFTSGIRRTPELSVQELGWIQNKCEQTLSEIEQQEPENERLKRNVKSYYDRMIKPNYKQFPDLIECLEIAEIKNISILNFVPQGRGRIISLVVNALYNMVDQIFIGWGIGYLGNGATNIVFPIVVI